MKLPRISSHECIKALLRADFYETRQRGSHINLRRDDPFARGSFLSGASFRLER
jgi:predicted RNA binding protein YcfA (HicA-like mRNA interferase family)